MKKILFLFILIATLLFGWSNIECKKEAIKLNILQNSIVTNSFEKLKPLSWAKYNKGITALYLGKDESVGKNLYGIELRTSKKMVAQIWYALVDKNISIAGKEFVFRTIDPKLMYIKSKTQVLRLNKTALQLAFGKLKYLSIILTPAHINKKLDCTKEIKIQKINYSLQNGQKIDAYKIEDSIHKNSIIVSDKVPFGFIKGGDVELISYGNSSKKPLIDKEERQKALNMPILF